MQLKSCLEEATSMGATDIYLHDKKVYFRKARQLIASRHSSLAFDPHNSTITKGIAFGQIEKKTDQHFRLLPKEFSLEELRYPLELKSTICHKHGLILIAGKTNSGKTTLLNHLVQSIPRSMVFIEDVHLPKQNIDCLYTTSPVNQDITLMKINSSEDAFSALRRSTNHLVIAQINCDGTVDTLRHLLFLLSKYDQKIVLDLIADQLKVLLITKLLLDKQQNILPLIGIVQVNQSISNKIKKNQFSIIEDYIHNGNAGKNSLSIDGQIVNWVQKQRITMQEALQNAINPSSMSLRAAGILHNE